MQTTPPFPARPINGGPLDRARPKPFPERWAYEPKVNGWRAVIHTPTATMFNRHGKLMSIAPEFSAVLGALRIAYMDLIAGDAHAFAPEWLDCEAFERRHALGRGSLVLFDYIPKPTDKTPWEERQQLLYDTFFAPARPIESPAFEAYPFEHTTPPENKILSFSYTYSDDKRDPDMRPAAAWNRLQALNKHLATELFEGLVAKRTDSPYPHTTSPNHETPHWIKHRWEF
jgi:ATP-dependent DNA ligase